jgi:hypothetical protein
VEELAMIALPTQPERDVLAAVVLALVAILVLTCLLRVAEAVAERIERRTDRPLLFVLHDDSPRGIEGLVERLRARARRLKEALAGVLRPPAAELEHDVEAEGDECARAGLRTDRSETRVRERERSALAEDVALDERDPALVAGEGLVVDGLDRSAGAAAAGDEGSDLGALGHDTNVRTAREGRNGG